MKATLQNEVWKEGDFFVAQCLNVDVSSFGETKDEALCLFLKTLYIFRH